MFLNPKHLVSDRCPGGIIAALSAWLEASSAQLMQSCE